MDITKSIRRKGLSDDGIVLASTYLKEFGQPDGVPDSLWRKELREARGRMVYFDPQSEIVTKSYGEIVDDSPGIMEFDCVLMTKSQDRDGDIIDPNGLEIDERMPLLWHHIMNQPVGAMKQLRDRDSDRILVKSVVADTPMGRDTAALIDVGALRISQGFKPTKATPLKRKMIRGKNVVTSWHVEKGFTIEHSVVSIPSNTGAVITAYSRKNLESPVIKSWAQKFYDSRPTIVPGVEMPAHYEIATRTGDNEIIVKSTDKDFVTKMSGMDTEDGQSKREVEDDKLNTERVSDSNPGVTSEEHFGHKGQGKAVSNMDPSGKATPAETPADTTPDKSGKSEMVDKDEAEGKEACSECGQEDCTCDGDAKCETCGDSPCSCTKEKGFGKSCDGGKDSKSDDKKKMPPSDETDDSDSDDTDEEDDDTEDDDSEDEKPNFNKSFLGQIETKMMGCSSPFLKGSFEQRSYDLRKAACKKLGCSEYKLSTVATFEDRVVLCKSDYEDGQYQSTCYEFSYSTKGNEVKIGEYSEVEIEPKVVKKFLSAGVQLDDNTLAHAGLSAIARADELDDETVRAFHVTKELMDIADVQRKDDESREIVKKFLASN